MLVSAPMKFETIRQRWKKNRKTKENKADTKFSGKSGQKWKKH